MSDAESSQALRSEMEQKVGRNVILFQQMELMLKYLLTYARIELRGNRVIQDPRIRSKDVKQKTLGPVVDQYLREVVCAEDNASQDEWDPSEPSFEFSFTLESGNVIATTKKQALEAIVNERNELIHSLLPRIQPGRVESYAETIEFLNKQYQAALPHLEELKSQCAGMKDALEFVSSGRAQKDVELAWLRRSRLVLLLGDIASQVAREDGWTLMTRAGQLAHQHAPEEMSALREKYGHKTLKQLLVATELFELKEEATEKGVRVLYRLKPGWTFGPA